MWIKILPGLGVALLFGLLFVSPGESPVGAATRATPLPEAPAWRAPRQPGALSARRAAAAFSELSEPASGPEERALSAMMGGSPATGALSRRDTRPPASGAAASRRQPAAPASTVGAEDASTGRQAPAKTSGIASNTALAVPGLSALDPFPPAATYPDLPPKGIRAWATAEKFRENQRARDQGHSIYRNSGALYSVGIRKDWSIDSIIGLSLDFHDGRMKSGRSTDTRVDDVDGYTVNAHYDGFLLGKYPVSAKAFYGRYESQTQGRLYHAGLPFIEPWIEDKHKSDVYGFSAKAGLPLLFGDDIKVLNEIGVDYRKLKGKAYAFTLQTEPFPYTVPKTSAASLSIPWTMTVSRDFLRCWGIVTPRVVTGLTLELDDSATAVRALNSSVAARADYNPVTRFMHDLTFDASQKVFCQAGFGVDVKTVSGWELSAEYTYHLAEKYGRSALRLEIGKCF